MRPVGPHSAPGPEEEPVSLPSAARSKDPEGETGAGLLRQEAGDLSTASMSDSSSKMPGGIEATGAANLPNPGPAHREGADWAQSQMLPLSAP